MASPSNNPGNFDPAAHPDDERLIDLALSGVGGAFDQLVNRYYNMVYVVAYGYLKEHDSAEDLAQETFLRAYAGLTTLRDRRTLPAWLNQIARNHALNWLKHGTRRSRVITMLPLDDFKDSADVSSPSAMDIAAAKEQAVRIEQAVLNLPEDLRTTVLLHYTAELSKSEVARRLGVHPSSVGRQLDRALHLLREKLGAAPSNPAINLPCRNDGISKTLALISAYSVLSAASQASLMQAAGGNILMPVASGQMAAVASGNVKIATWVAAAVVAAGIGAGALVMRQPSSSISGETVAPHTLFQRFAAMFSAGKPEEHFAVAGALEAATKDDSSGPRTTIHARSVPVSSRHKTVRGVSRNVDSRAGSVNALSRRNGLGTTCPVVLVSGRVLFDNQEPITTATVELWSSSDRFADLWTNTARRLDVSPVGKDGSYSVAGDDSGNLSVEVKGVSRAIADIESIDLESTAPAIRRIAQDFVIPAPHTVRGRVVADNNVTVTSAIVSLRSADEISDGWYFGNQQTTVSETGEFEIPGVVTGKATIGASAEGRAGILQEIDVPASGPVMLRLTRGTAAVTGHIIDSLTDQPFAGARLSIRPTGKLHTLGLTRPVTATVDSSGYFRLDNLLSGPHIISAKTASGNILYASTLESDSTRFQLRPVLTDGNTTDVLLRMFTGITISGLVTDQETSEPMAGVAVNLCRYEEPVYTAVSNEQGRYEFRNINPDYQFKLRVVHPGFILGIDTDYSTEKTPAVIAWPAPGETALTRDLPLVPVVNLSGIVQNSESFPIAGAGLEWMDSSGQSVEGKTRSDLQGQFQLQFPPFQNGNLLVTANGYACTVSNPIEIAKEDITDLKIILEREAILEGSILTADEVPIPDATISSRITFPFGRSTMTQDGSAVKSDTNGHYRLTGIPSGKGQIKVSAEGYIPATVDLEFQPGDHRTRFDIKLESGLSIEGTLVDENDNLISGMLQLETDRVDMVQNDGKFKFDGLKPGSYTISATAANGTAKVTLSTGDRNAVIRIVNDTADIHCRVVDALTGQPIEKFSLNQGDWKYDGEGPGGFRFKARKSSDGSINMPEIYAWADGYPKHYIKPKPVTENEIVEIKLGTGSVITGRVMSNPAGRPVPDIPVTVSFDREVYGQMQKVPPITNTITDAEGHFTLANLPAGKVTIKALPNQPLYQASVNAELKAGETMDIGDIAVGEPGALRGRIIQLPSTPLPGLDLRLVGPYGPEGTDFYGENAKSFTARSDSRGEFLIEELPPGRYSIKMPERAEYSQGVTVESGKTSEMTIQFGSTTVSGQVTRGGQPLPASIGYQNVTTLQMFSSKRGSGSDLAPDYTILDITPGDYKVWIMYQTAENAFASKFLSVTVPDQPAVIQNLVLPAD